MGANMAFAHMLRDDTDDLIAVHLRPVLPIKVCLIKVSN